MSGYLVDERLDTSALVDGWFNTGDLGWIDERGFLNLRGRQAEVINVSGMKVLPSEVEEVITTLPGVTEVKVYAGKTRAGAQHVRAAVAGEGINIAQIKAHCEKHLVYYKRPAPIILMDALPRSSTERFFAACSLDRFRPAALAAPTRIGGKRKHTLVNLGNWQLDTVDGGALSLDGGVVYGVVPKVLWEKLTPADAHNRLRLRNSCLLARDGSHTVLIDTGYGGKHDRLDRLFYELEEGEPLLGSLAALGVSPEQVDTVVFSHLHFDHAGGASRVRPPAPTRADVSPCPARDRPNRMGRRHGPASRTGAGLSPEQSPGPGSGREAGIHLGQFDHRARFAEPAHRRPHPRPPGAGRRVGGRGGDLGGGRLPYGSSFAAVRGAWLTTPTWSKPGGSSRSY